MTLIDLNFDGFPGPTHHFGGLGYGNMASKASALSSSSPRRAALQAIEKMKMMVDMGVIQGILPPHPRPYMPLLAEFKHPIIVRVANSSSFMWAANAATVTAAPDAADGRIHFTPANLVSNLHRSIEASLTTQILGAIFHDTRYFKVHSALPAAFPDEGAANWTRLQRNDGTAVSLAVYGRSIRAPDELPHHIVPRQSKEALELIADRHGMGPDSVVFLKQSPQIVDQGVFHNDVIATGHGDLMIMHEAAYDAPSMHLLDCVHGIRRLVVSNDELSVPDAVESYWFNSQIVRDGAGRCVMIAPERCMKLPHIERLTARVIAAGIDDVRFVSLSESLANGGGPACVRLRVPISHDMLAAIPSAVIMTQSRLNTLTQCVMRWYPEALNVSELATVHQNTLHGLRELWEILGMGKLFDLGNPLP